MILASDEPDRNKSRDLPVPSVDAASVVATAGLRAMQPRVHSLFNHHASDPVRAAKSEPSVLEVTVGAVERRFHFSGL